MLEHGEIALVGWGKGGWYCRLGELVGGRVSRVQGDGKSEIGPSFGAAAGSFAMQDLTTSTGWVDSASVQQRVGGSQ